MVLDAPTTQQGLAYDVPDFSDYYYWAPGSTGRLTVRAEAGTPGLAIYTLGDPRPEGLTTGGVTFRQSPAGLELLAGDVSEGGEREVVVPATSTTRGIELYVDCETSADEAYVHLELGGRSAVEGGGCGGLPVDASSGGSFAFPTQIGEDVSARVYLTDGPRGPRIAPSDLRLSVGVYARTGPENPGSRESYLPATLEHEGHVWRRVSRADATGEREVEGIAPDGARPVLAQLYLATAEGRVTALVNGERGPTRMAAGTSGGPVTLVQPGQTVTLRISGSVDPDDELSIGFYEQVD